MSRYHAVDASKSRMTVQPVMYALARPIAVLLEGTWFADARCDDYCCCRPTGRVSAEG